MDGTMITCTACCGHGMVQVGTYSVITGDTNTEMCRTCNGSGVLHVAVTEVAKGPSPFYPIYPAYRGPPIVDPPAIGSPEHLKLEAQD